MRTTERFSSRVADYVRYRPQYPPETVAFLAAEFGLGGGSRVADLGSGTGFLSEPLLQFGCEVFGVEPNAEMRAAGEDHLTGYARFHSIDGTAELTGLEPASVDMVTAGQSFHWFDIALTRIECSRIVRPGGGAALIWNNRRDGATPFMHGYENLLLQHEPGYSETTHRRIGPSVMNQFFGSGNWRLAKFPNRQELDWEGLVGRMRSSSYIPLPGTPQFAALEHHLRGLFEANEEDGRVAFLYETEIYYGGLS